MMGNKRYNNVFKKYVDNLDMFNYELGCDEDTTKEEFTKCAYKKIDLFINYLYKSMCSKYGYNDKTVLLCQSIRKVLKNNLYNNDVNVFDLFCNMFQIPYDSSVDYGLFPAFSYSYNNNLEMFGNDLVIQVLFESPQCGDDLPVFQIRCHYEQMEGQYNNNFDKYFESESFLTTDDYYKYYEIDKNDEDEWCEDNIGIYIVKLSYCELFGNLYDKEVLKDNIDNFHKDMSDLSIELKR